ncbi:MFS transporter [Symbioplanes lichenis]|uniref:MFS transporter n=1 Tax=Symbioplanes lichenis TaxID=1629072 RepID=UPI00273A4FF1|nr:MFS transporter [Actinoplanes lichenis]
MRAYGPWAVFGLFWGAWGASIPAVRDQAGVTDGQLGVALLFIGLGALPAMAYTGRVVDRWGTRVASLLIAALGVTGPLMVLGARGLVSLAAGLALLGAASGAADVAINALAAESERLSGRPVIARSHATFSASVVLGSILAGVLLAVGAPVVAPFLVVLAGSLVARAGRRSAPAPRREAAPRVNRLMVIGLVAALAFAVENAHQSWSAVFLHDVLAAGPGGSAAAPAVFAGIASITRFALGGLGGRHPGAVLVAGGAAAVAGTATVAAANSSALALTGLAVAAAGTAVLYPTLIGAGLSHVPDAARGRATSRVATTAYLGFLAGPVYVGFVASHGGLRGAFLAVAALAALFAVVAAPVVKVTGAAHIPLKSPGHDRD